MIVGIVVATEGTGVIADGEGAGVEGRAVTEGDRGVVVAEEEDNEELVVDPLAGLLLPDLIVIVVEDVVMVPSTHCPFCRMSPNLLEQILQPTPPSLKVKG